MFSHKKKHPISVLDEALGVLHTEYYSHHMASVFSYNYRVHGYQSQSCTGETILLEEVLKSNQALAKKWKGWEAKRDWGNSTSTMCDSTCDKTGESVFSRQCETDQHVGHVPLWSFNISKWRAIMRLKWRKRGIIKNAFNLSAVYSSAESG